MIHPQRVEKESHSASDRDLSAKSDRVNGPGFHSKPARDCFMANSAGQSNGMLRAKGGVQTIWLLEERQSQEVGGAHSILQKLAAQASESRVFLGSCPAKRDYLHKIFECRPDVIVIQEASWPDSGFLNELLELNAVYLVICSTSNPERAEFLAQHRAAAFVAANAGLESYRLALRSLSIWQTRETVWRAQVTALQQRLTDRILIERAKGILIKKLSITEEEAYKRLRLSSRRQRRQIRDIAQALIDTEVLLCPQESEQRPSFCEPIGSHISQEESQNVLE